MRKLTLESNEYITEIPLSYSENTLESLIKVIIYIFSLHVVKVNAYKKREKGHNF